MKDSIDKKKIEETLAYLRSVPYDVRPSRLYDAATLYAGYDYTCDSGFDECYDSRIYRHYLQCGKHTADVSETFARTIHDYAIGVALDKFLDGYDRRHCVGVMGGHALSRTDVMYAEIARISKTLTERGFLMLGGGGPGAMEATHLGAWMAGRSEAELDDALGILAPAADTRCTPTRAASVRATPKAMPGNNTNHVARNLLGIAYYQVGMVSDALKQWIISSSIKQKNKGES